MLQRMSLILLILLFQPPKYSDYRYVLPYLALFIESMNK